MIKNKSTKQDWTRWGCYLLGAFLLSIPAFYNGYPLVYSDSGTYIRSGMEMYVPSDRPLIYGLFMRIVSLGYSLWFVVFAQCIALSFVLTKLIKHCQPSISSLGSVLIIGILTAFTSIGWYASQLMPDLFTFCSIACVVLLANSTFKLTASNILLLLIAIFSFNVHFTNILIGGLLLCFLILLKYWEKGAFNSLNIKILSLVLICSLATGLLVNYSVSKAFSLSKGGHIFLVGRMIDNGVLQSYLDDKCDQKNYSLCQYKDSLPTDSREFLWSPMSPVTQEGWEQTGPEYREILAGILTSPKHLIRFIYTSTTATISQLFQNDLGSGLKSTWYTKPSSPPYAAVADFYPQEMNQYLQSRQNENLWGQNLDFSMQNMINHLLLIASVFVITIGVSIKQNRESLRYSLKQTIVVLIAGVVINAWVTASLANVYDRLQSRISWVLVLIAILILLQLGKRLYNNAVKLF